VPRIEPPPRGPTWPVDELAIGVVGVAPWATVEFLRALYGLIEATKDWQHPRVLIDANSKIPSRGRHFELGETDPSPAIRETIDELVAAGAGVVVVPCNTAHLLYDRWAGHVAVPVPNILRVSVERVAALGGTCVAVLESTSLRARDAYGAAAREAGLRTVALTDSEAAGVAGWIASVKQRGRPTDSEKGAFGDLAGRLVARGADALLLGCTELGAFVDAAPADCRVVDSNVELARVAAVLARCAVVRPK
jgi:aspartate racemase